MPSKLSPSEIQTAITDLRGWTVAEDKLHREYQFPDFVHAFGFMATAAIAIEVMGHHPEWANVYNRVTVDLSTHDAGGITEKDVELARKLEGIAQRLQ
jgi:4a-hydroxytetrahydrobiopterin dehydratase